jgi:F0F1-type ATP synthase beta subunit
MPDFGPAVGQTVQMASVIIDIRARNDSRSSFIGFGLRETTPRVVTKKTE